MVTNIKSSKYLSWSLHFEGILHSHLCCFIDNNTHLFFCYLEVLLLATITSWLLLFMSSGRWQNTLILYSSMLEQGSLYDHN